MNIPTKSLEQIRQKSLTPKPRASAKSNSSSGSSSSSVSAASSLAASAAVASSTTMSSSGKPSTTASASSVTTNTTPGKGDSAKAEHESSILTSSVDTGQRACEPATSVASPPPGVSTTTTTSLLSTIDVDFGAEYEKACAEAASAAASSGSESEDKMNEMMRASERLEAFINKMMRRAECLNTTSEEQFLQKQQILEELQKVEHELQEKAKNPLLLLNAQSKQDLPPSSPSLLQQAASPLQTQAVQHQQTIQVQEGPNGQQIIIRQKVEFPELPENTLLPDSGQPSLGMLLPVSVCEQPDLRLPKPLEGDQDEDEEDEDEEDEDEDPDLVYHPNSPAELEDPDGDVSDRSLEAVDDNNPCNHGNGGALSILTGSEEDLRTAQLAKQESLSSGSSASSSSSSSADSGCGNSDTNGLGADGSEVDGPPLESTSGDMELASGQQQVCDDLSCDSRNIANNNEAPSSSEEEEEEEDEEEEDDDGGEAAAIPPAMLLPSSLTSGDEEGPKTFLMTENMELITSHSERAGSEEVDLTNVIPIMEFANQQQLDNHLRALQQQQQQQQQLQQKQQSKFVQNCVVQVWVDDISL